MNRKVTVGAVLIALAGARLASAEWYDDVRVKGDMRYRFENIYDESATPASNYRDRLRARLGAFARVNNDIDAAIQITTDEPKGSANKADPISRNQTLTDQSAPKGIFLDLAYIDYKPGFVKGADLIAGKMKNPFITVNDYLWDGDLNPEGVALQYKTGKDLQLLANAGYIWEYQQQNKQVRLYAAQPALRYNIDKDSYGMAGASLNYFDGMKGHALLDYSAANKSYGNTTAKQISGSTTNIVYASDYFPVEGFVAAGFKVYQPITLFGSYTVNTKAESGTAADDNKKAWSTGLKIGKLSDPGAFELGYDYRYLEADAFPGFMTDSDSWGGGTDGKGSRVSLAYQWLKGFNSKVTYFIDNKKIHDGTTYNRLQVDFNVKF